jgi:hypothetical protein
VTMRVLVFSARPLGEQVGVFRRRSFFGNRKGRLPRMVNYMCALD